MCITCDNQMQSTFWLDLTHRLLEQFTIDDFLSCLQQQLTIHPSLCQVALLINTSQSLHWHGVTPASQGINDSFLLENGPLHQIQTTHQPVQLTANAYQQRYPALYQAIELPDFHYYVGLPLANGQGGYHLCELFSQQPFEPIELLRHTLSIAMAHLQSHVQLRSEQQQLCQQRDDFHLLVNVTNSVLAQRDINQVIKQIAQEIHRYFAIDAITITLPAQRAQQIISYSTFFYHDQQINDCQQQALDAHTPSKQVFTSAKSCVYTLRAHAPANERSAADQKLFELWPAPSHQLGLIPISFAGKVCGVLQIAHGPVQGFADNKLKLLEQIAERVGIAIDNARAYQQIKGLKEKLVHENHYLSEQIDQMDHQFNQIIGRSSAIGEVLKQIEIVAKTNCSVLLLGETGTGKELFAKAIHQLSPRAKQRMVKMNCAAMPAGLLESDLFGHEKGAFTGASNSRIGRFELAHESSLFLDEIGDMPIELQPKLLRVLQEKEFERVGGNKLINVDVRLIAATNRDLKLMVEDKTFRSDLFYRLNVFPVRLPPLRERLEDIPTLVKFFTFKAARRLGREINSIPANVLQQLQQHPWPGNVRELENVVERAVLLSPGRELCLPSELNLQGAFNPAPINRPVVAPLDMQQGHQYQQIIQALKATNGIVAGPRGAAQKLGIKRTTLLSRMKRLGIDKQAVLEEQF
ncbi:sigma 54-interacting transcriptional regulator [Celerinatantimonas yamalensis]|uniref:Sigma 54-interacting transcriptional regulator n=1 Tax=Celerinatantimonas yamalensis TaxID=559956 RepID=A0ABW9GBN1_9GAMM